MEYRSIGLEKEELLKMYEMMVLIREFEININNLYQKGLVYGGVHLGVGQEALMVGSCFGLEKEDKICNSHRAHGACIVKGLEPKKVMAELLSRTTGASKGNGGSMHICDEVLGILGTHSCLGDSVTVAAGMALAIKIHKKKNIVVSFFGDGCINTGALHEGLNMAAVMNLPVLFICENNGYGMSLKIEKSIKVKSVTERVAGYGIEGRTIDGNDVLEVYRAVQEAVKSVRNGEGPLFIECRTYRWYGHMVGDPALYRPKEELNLWKKENDPVSRYEKFLTEENIAAVEELEGRREKSKTVIEEAIEYGLKSPEPTMEQIYEYVYYQN